MTLEYSACKRAQCTVQRYEINLV